MNHATSENAMPAMQAEWVMAQYSGEQAKSVIGLANEGIRYKILEQPQKGSGWVKVAFRRPLDKARPQHLAPVTSPDLLRRLEAWSRGE